MQIFLQATLRTEMEKDMLKLQNTFLQEIVSKKLPLMLVYVCKIVSFLCRMYFVEHSTHLNEEH